MNLLGIHILVIYWLKQEGNTALLDHLNEEGIDLRKNPIEWMTYEQKIGFPNGGVLINEEGETSLKGLYAAGDESFGGISGARSLVG
jgi:aspartate oxidase